MRLCRRMSRDKSGCLTATAMVFPFDAPTTMQPTGYRFRLDTPHRICYHRVG